MLHIIVRHLCAFEQQRTLFEKDFNSQWQSQNNLLAQGIVWKICAAQAVDCRGFLNLL